ncbi:MAG: uracil-DNA glycosylase family protein [Cyclobacteriaceae bacterium]
MSQSYNADLILQFIKNFGIHRRISSDVTVLEPWNSTDAFKVCELFYHKFYNDKNKRIAIFGINPGRFGGGQTGIPFTDPVRLAADCGIANPFPSKPELSSEFVYRVISEFGGPEKFYGKFFITSVCPVGFTKNGVNLNYYDDDSLSKLVQQDLPLWMKQQLEIGLHTDLCFCLGEGKNYKFIKSMNEKFHWFKSIVPLPHPRFIMQYRRKRLSEFSELYLTKLKTAAEKI